nr:BRCT domain-containing protein [Entomospira entomophilus]
MALKPPPQSQESILEAVEWQISRQGLYIPIALIQPTNIGGAVISRATLNNVVNVESLRLHIGHRLLLERANDVIPYIRDNLDKDLVVKEQDDLIPTHCYSCGLPLHREGVHLKCISRECDEVIIQSIIYWVKSLEMKEIGGQTIRKLFTAGLIHRASDLYRLQYEALMTLEGFAQKRVERLLEEIRSSQKLPALQFLSMLGIPLVGRKALIRLGVISIDTFYSFQDDRYVIGRNLIQWRDEEHNQAFVTDLLSVVEIISDEEGEDTLQSLPEVVFTGKGPFSRKELSAIAMARGYQVGNSIAESTSLLVADDVSGVSSKSVKARKKGIPIISYEDFLRNVNKEE